MNSFALVFVLVVFFMSACSTKSTKPTSKATVLSAKAPSALFAKCNGGVRSLESILKPIVRSMTSQKIPYSQSPSNEWRDCSGNFLRLSSYVASACPDQALNLAAPAGVKNYKRGRRNAAPGRAKARSTKALAAWYKSRGRFTPIFYDGVTSVAQAPASLRRARNHIEAGSVLWFSRKRPEASAGVGSLISNINHMAVVTKVKRDPRGNVLGFDMFHGRNKGTVAKVTNQHFWVWPLAYLSSGKQYPPFGYWRQYLVGYGALL